MSATPRSSKAEPLHRTAQVAAVLPAYNEEATIAGVVAALRACPLISEVVVVSDGSTDATAARARAAGARVVELPENLGKGGAMRAGLASTTAEVVVFLDADLVGLTPAHVRDLVEPVLSGRTDMAVGVFEGGRPFIDLAQALAPHLSGQRAVRREVVEEVPTMDVSRFGVEAALTRYIRRQGRPVEEVVLRNVTHRTKEEKLGLVKGFAARMKMYWEIARYLP
jgi:glycosyltransferase involved in cell wall biosynthesis